MMKKATKKAATAETVVFWDMNMCPVPAGCDPRVVRGLIKRLLEKNGYGGPLTVTAYGKLGDVPRDMLRGVYSSGIALINVPCGSSDIVNLIDPTEDIPPGANFMLISDWKACSVQLLQMLRYNPIEPFPYDSLKHLILEGEDSFSGGEFEKEETTGEMPLWDCFVCARDPPSQGFENFTTHLDSEEHHELMLIRNTNYPPCPPRSFDDYARDALLLEHMVQNNLLLPKQVFPPPTIETTSGYSEIDWKRVISEHETVVLWDINSCPVPPGFDASLVGPCIRRFLKKEGCSGPLTIIAIGLLTHVPTDILRKVYSSGINLHNVPYGPPDTANLIARWSSESRPIFNIMVISTSQIFAYNSDSLHLRCNLLKPFPIVSLQSFLLADAWALDEGSEKVEGFSLICSVCDYHMFSPEASLGDFARFCMPPGFKSFNEHLSSPLHHRKLSELLPMSNELRILSKPLSEPLEINLEGVTSVFWDMKMCPVPPGCDPRRVRPCIKRFLENKGYSGPLTMTAFGVLTDVPIDILRGVYSSGITLNNRFSACSDLIYGFTLRNPPPANILVISNAKLFSSDYASRLQMEGYNLVQPFPCDSLESFFLADSGALEEDMCSDSALWICKVCSQDGQGFENFTTHVTSRRHERKLLDWLPRDARILRRHGDKGWQAKLESAALRIGLIGREHMFSVLVSYRWLVGRRYYRRWD